jgi:hypothetical protein
MQTASGDADASTPVRGKLPNAFLTPYTCRVVDYSHEQLRERYISAMDKELGEVFHHLMQEAARLHLKWNEYDALYSGRANIETLNRAAPGFFWMAQNALWNDLLLHICRMTDDRSDVLSVQRLSKLVKVALLASDRCLLSLCRPAPPPQERESQSTHRHSEWVKSVDP